MPKFIVYATYSETRSMEVEAEDEGAAIEYAQNHEEELEPNGSDDYSYEAEEIYDEA